MDALCWKTGIHALTAPPIAASASMDIRLGAAAADKSSLSAAMPSNTRWGSSFGHSLRSLWPGSKNRFEPAIAVDDAVLVEEKEEIGEADDEGMRDNRVFQIPRLRMLERGEGKFDDIAEDMGVKLGENDKHFDGECDFCAVGDDDERIEFDRESFSKLLRKVSLEEARLYARMSYLGTLSYSIPEIKPENLQNTHGLRFVTSSMEKKEQSSKGEGGKVSAELQQAQVKSTIWSENQDTGIRVEEQSEEEANSNENRSSVSAAYHIATSAASYLHSHAQSFLSLKSSKSLSNEDTPKVVNGNVVNVDLSNPDMASFIATTDSVTAVVAAKEEVKQAVADNLNSTRSSPCEWFVCDDDQSATRFFVIQGSESMASWQANLLFEPILFEGKDVLVHRGIYEAAKGIYEQMLPEIKAHFQTHGNRATFRFTGHSLGGSLSLLVNLMLLIRGDVPRSSLLPVITFGAPSVMCGGDHLLRTLGLPRNHVRSIMMHRDIVPRAFSCHYPDHVSHFLKAINGNFRNLPCLDNQKLLYAPMGEFLILQPDDNFSPNHHLLPSGCGLYVLSGQLSDIAEAEKQILAAQSAFLNSPHPLDILGDRSAYGFQGTIQRDHDMSSYLKSVRQVIRRDLNRLRKSKKEHRWKVWWPLYAPNGVNAGIIISQPVTTFNLIGQAQFKLSGIVQTGTESLRRFSTLVASKHMNLLVVLLLPAKSLIGGHID